jgi:transposase
MAGRRLMSMDVRELLLRFRSGQINRSIAREVGIARKTLARYRRLAESRGLLEGEMVDMRRLDEMLEESQPKINLPAAIYKAEPFREPIEMLRRQGVEMKTVFLRLRDQHGFAGSSSALYRFVRRIEDRAPEGFVRIETAPGEQAQVDFGSAGMIANPATGELRKAHFFVMTLSYSRHQFVRFVFDQTVSTWLRCHREAFEYFGGVTEKIVLDNLKAAIVRAVLHDPAVQRSYRELAELYGFLISPCRPKTPRHKDKVESGVRYVKRSFLAGRKFRDINDANEQALVWVETIAGVRIHGTVKERPLHRFEIERGALRPLATAPYDFEVWKTAKLHPDCHICLDEAFYSAPHRLIGKTLWVRSNVREVVIFHDYCRVATHPWGPRGTRRTNPAHYPPHKAAYLMATPQYCMDQARMVGPYTADLVGRLLDERPLDHLRTAQAVLRLREKYGANRLEAACRRAICFDDPRYGTLKRILDHGLEAEPLPDFDAPRPPGRVYVFARPGSEIFSNQGGSDHGSETSVDPQAQVLAAVGHSGNAGCP